MYDTKTVKADIAWKWYVKMWIRFYKCMDEYSVGLLCCTSKSVKAMEFSFECPTLSHLETKKWNTFLAFYFFFFCSTSTLGLLTIWFDFSLYYFCVVCFSLSDFGVCINLNVCPFLVNRLHFSAFSIILNWF